MMHGSLNRPDATELKFTDDLKQILEVIASTGNYWLVKQLVLLL
jgi:uncharacterized membrane protein